MTREQTDREDSAATARAVIQRCANDLKARCDREGAPASKTEARNRLLSSLHRSFEEAHPAKAGTEDVVVLSLDKPAKYFALQWKRSEFLHDLCVVEVGNTQSAYRRETIGFVRRVLWQVESEISSNGRDVAEDLSKLIAGRAAHKLLITARPGQPDVKPWLDFLGRVWSGSNEALLIAMIDSYATDGWKATWCAGHGPRFDLYRLEPFAGSPTEIAIGMRAEAAVTPHAPA